MKKSPFAQKVVLIFLFAHLFLSFLNADEKTDKVDKLFSTWDSTVSPGAALAVIKDGEIIYKRGYGMANLEHNIPITTTSVFRIGSTSKQFTATCMAILSLQGKISLDDDIRKYIPEMPQYQRPITIRNLIHHTSGIRDYTTLLSLAGYVSYLDHPTVEETLEIIARQKSLNFPPGEKYSYSNSNYFLLSIIVERVTGKSLNEFAQEYIFKPLGMENTHFHNDLTLIVKNRAVGYSPTKEGFRIDMSTFDQVGDGGLYTTVEDLYLWDQAFYNNKLGKELMELIQTPGELNSGEKLDYAFGLRIGEYRGLKTIGHGGSWVGFRSAFLRFPEQKFAVVCLANLSTINPSFLCKKVADIFLANGLKAEPEKEAKREITPIALPKEKLERLIGNYQDEESGMWVTICVEDDKLKVAYQGQEFLLLPVSETKFQALDAPYGISLDFAPEVKGKPRKAKLSMRGREEITLVKAPKVTPLSPSQLKEYSGEYYSDELMVTYKLMIKEGALALKHRYEPIELKIMAPDKFIAGRMNVDFQRDKRNKILGFSLSAGRVRNIKFTRK